MELTTSQAAMLRATAESALMRGNDNPIMMRVWAALAEAVEKCNLPDGKRRTKSDGRGFFRIDEDR